MMSASLSRNGSECKCPLCFYTTTTIKGVLSHIRAFHANEPHFCVVCGLDGCSTTSTTFSELYSHVYRHHSDCIDKRGQYNHAQISCDEVEEQASVHSENPDIPVTDHDQGTFFVTVA